MDNWPRNEFLHDSEDRFRAIFETAPVPMLVLDDGAVVRRCNEAAARLAGDCATKMMGHRGGEALRCANHYAAPAGCGTGAGCLQCVLRNTVTRTLLHGVRHSSVPLSINIVRAGEPVERQLLASTTPLAAESRPLALVCLEDVTDRLAAEQRLRHAALHDDLTGLPNRKHFVARLAASLDHARGDPAFRFAVMFLDLDRFKIINDSLGHCVGDGLLMEIARRLRRCALTSGDVACIARLGGDEFAVLVERPALDQDAAGLAARLLLELSEPAAVEGHEVHSTISIGLVFGHRRYDRPEDLLRDADTAMYRAKAGGKNRVVVFDETMHRQTAARLEMENDLRHAVESRGLTLAYQPILNLESGGMEDLEALLRWRHPSRGAVSPAEFIPLAEETGLIVPLGWQVLEEACRQLPRLTLRTLPAISVNLSKRQLQEPDLVARVAAVLEQTGAAPGRVTLEVTESVVMRHAESVMPVLRHLKALGIRLAMDDFGTGHSSLSCLHQFPLDIVKIDRSFIANLSVSRQFSAVVHAIVLLAHNLGMKIVAEGIETSEQLVQLQALDCDYGQGFLLARPMDETQLSEYLAQAGRHRISA